jgi:hypothetical protein
MTKLTYRQAYDKIIEAYFKDEIKPFDPDFCFCGNLNDKSWTWGGQCDERKYYTADQYVKMEKALFRGMNEVRNDATSGGWKSIKNTDAGERSLFEGMCAALEVLKQIHIERGEIIDETPAFTKRELVAAN